MRRWSGAASVFQSRPRERRQRSKKTSSRAVSLETADLLGGNFVNMRVWRSCTGRATHIATPPSGWLQCVAMICKPAWIHRGQCPPGCVWTKQLQLPLRWMKASLAGVRAVSAESSRSTDILAEVMMMMMTLKEVRPTVVRGLALQA